MSRRFAWLCLSLCLAIYICQVYPMVLQNPQSQTVIEGRKVKFECKFSGDSKPVITWEKDGKDLPEQSERYTITGSLLTIPSPVGDDSGLYRCSAKLGQVIERSEVAELKVREKVAIETSVRPKFDVGEMAKLHCRLARGEKPVDIKWTKQGIPEGLLPHMEANGTILYIKNARPSDSGNYTCTMNNSFSKVTRVIVLMIYQYAVFVTKPKNVTVLLDESALFNCSTKGNPKPHVVWYKGGDLNWKKVDPSDRIKILKNDSLLILNVKKEDELLYKCVVGNAGNIVQAVAVLKIKRKKEYAVFVTKPKNATVLLNESALFNCSLKGNPKPSMIWYKGKDYFWKKINPSNRIEILKNGSLLILNVKKEDELTYNCIGGNAGNIVGAVASLKIRTHEEYAVFATKPKNVTVLLDESALFNCSTKGNPKPHVVWYKGGDLNWKKIGPSDRIKILKNDSLLILNVKKEDELPYKCVVGNAGNIVEAVAILKIKRMKGFPLWNS